jgi:hypothetical protein
VTRDDLVNRGQQLIERAAQAGAVARLLGGVAVALNCPSAALPPLARSYQDLDVVARRQDAEAISRAFRDMGLIADQRFNALHGETRLLFYDPDADHQIDVFLGRFTMCHRLEFDGRLPHYATRWTIAVTDLFLTKLQIVEMNPKDLQDAAAILLDHPLDPSPLEDPGSLSARRLRDILGSDWGFWTTVKDNLARLAMSLSRAKEPWAARLADRTTTVSDWLDKVPKSTAWKLRSRIGRKIPWYELPEEVRR